MLKYFARLVVILTAMPIHEFAHGYVASKLGDDTPERSGRLTINPLAHLDFFGTVMIMLCGVGFAKPVPVNPYNFRGDKNKGMALTALAGPVSNILMALVIMIIYKLVFYMNLMLGGVGALSTLGTIFSMMVSINISLAVFNLLPIFPLDGSRIFAPIIPEKAQNWLEDNSQIITMVLIVCIMLGFLDLPLGILNSLVVRLLDFITKFVDLIFRAILL